MKQKTAQKFVDKFLSSRPRRASQAARGADPKLAASPMQVAEELGPKKQRVSVTAPNCPGRPWEIAKMVARKERIGSPENGLGNA
jgi:hypothetical protein